MKVTILSFGSIREIFGNKFTEIEVPDTTTVDSLKALLESKYPRIKGIASYMVAINDEYASGDSTIKQSDEIAVIPPVCGG